jgi:hypothetical protein
VLFMDTPGNRVGIQQVMDMALDPDSPNDVLKSDYNADTDTGGDDWYDAWRYGLMSRPITPKVKLAAQDRINQNRMFAKAPDTEAEPVPWAARQPNPLNRTTRIEKIV